MLGVAGRAELDDDGDDDDEARPRVSWEKCDAVVASPLREKMGVTSRT